MKLIKSFVLAFTVLIAATGAAYSQTAMTSEATEMLKTVTVKVRGITCSKDLKMITDNVEKLKGVSSCRVAKKGTTTTFVVKYDAELVTEKEIFTAIESTGSCENPDERPYKVKQ